MAVDLLTEKYVLSRIWEKHKAEVTESPDFLQTAIPKAIMVYKSKVLKLAISKLTDELSKLKPDQVEETNQLLLRLKDLYTIMNKMSKDLDRVIL